MSPNLNLETKSLASIAPAGGISHPGIFVPQARTAHKLYLKQARLFYGMQGAVKHKRFERIMGRSVTVHRNHPKKLILAACIHRFIKADPQNERDLKGQLAGSGTSEDESYGVLGSFLESIKIFHVSMRGRAAQYVEALDKDGVREEIDNVLLPHGRNRNYTAEQQRYLLLELARGMEASEAGTNYMLDSVSADVGTIPTPWNPEIYPIPLFHPKRLDVLLPELDPLINPNPPDLSTIPAYHIALNADGNKRLVPEKLATVENPLEKIAKAYLLYVDEIMPFLAGSVEEAVDVATRDLRVKTMSSTAYKMFETILPSGALTGVAQDDADAVVARIRQHYPNDTDVWTAHPPHIARSIVMVYGTLAVVSSFEKLQKGQITAENYLTAMKDLTDLIGGIGAIGVLHPFTSATRKTLERSLTHLNMFTAGLDMYLSYTKMYDSLGADKDFDEAIGPTLTAAGATLAAYSSLYAAWTAASISGAATAATGPGALVIAATCFTLALLGGLISAWSKPTLQEKFVRYSYFGKGDLKDKHTTNTNQIHYKFYNPAVINSTDTYIADIERQIGGYLSFLGLVHHINWTTVDPDPVDGNHYKTITIEFNMALAPGDTIFFSDRYRVGEIGRDHHVIKRITGTQGWDYDAWEPSNPSDPASPLRFPAQFQEVWTKTSDLTGKLDGDDELMLEKVHILVGYPAKSSFNDKHEIVVKFQNAFSRSLQRSLVSEAAGVPAEELVLDEPLKLFFLVNPGSSSPNRPPRTKAEGPSTPWPPPNETNSPSDLDVT